MESGTEAAAALGSGRSDSSELIDAVLAADGERVRALLETEGVAARVNDVDGEGMSALHWASAYNEPAILGLLLECDDVRVDTRNRRKYTPLHYAVMHGARQTTELLLADERCNVNCVNEWGESSLHLAAHTGDVLAIAVLLNGGADATLRDRWGSSAREAAAAYGEKDAEMILQQAEEGSLPALPPRSAIDGDAGGESAREHADDGAAEGPDDVREKRSLAKLIEAPLDEARFEQLLKDRTVCKNGADYYGNTALHKCAAWNRERALRRLLECDLDEYTPTGPDGDTPLHMAVQCGAAQCVRLLCVHEKTRETVHVRNSNGQTPLHVAVGSGRVDLVDVLLAAGVRVS